MTIYISDLVNNQSTIEDHVCYLSEQAPLVLLYFILQKWKIVEGYTGVLNSDLFSV